MKKKRLILLVLSVIVLLGVLTAVIISVSEPTEPTYQGKRLSYWLREYDLSRETKKREAINQALRENINTNAIPTLLRLLRAKDSASKLKLMWALERIPLIKFHYWPAEPRNRAAGIGFGILGSNAAPAVPELMEILSERISEESEIQTIASLGSIGPKASAAVPSLLKCIDEYHEIPADFPISALGRIHSRPEIAVPALARLLNSTNEAYALRSSWALANFGAAASNAIPALVAALQRKNALTNIIFLHGSIHGSPWDEAFVEAIAEIHSMPEIAIPALMREMNETKVAVKEAAKAIAAFGTNAAPAVPGLVEILSTAHPDRASVICSVLGWIHSMPQIAVPALAQQLRGPNDEVRESAVTALGQYGNEALPALPALAEILLKSQDEILGLNAITTITNIHCPPESVIPILIQSLDHPGRHVADRVAYELGTFGPSASNAVPVLIPRLTNQSVLVRRAAAKVLGDIGISPETVVPALTLALSDRRPDVRENAACSLGKFGTNANPAIAKLKELAANGDAQVKAAAVEALKKIDPASLEQAIKDGRVKSP